MTGKYALIIANTEYTDPGLARLTAPGKDAEDFARVLRSPELAAFDKVFTLINRDVFLVNQAVEDFFTGKKPSDLLLLYFSGHGVRDENGALYLAVRNTNRGRLRSTAIKADFIREAMDHSRSKRLLLILDCCNSGAFAQGTKAAIGGSVGTATAFRGTGYGRIVLTASDATQFAWEGDKVIGETDNSLFTHFLVTGLEGEADLDGDGRITVDELYDYAYEQIVTRTPKQTPGKWSYSQQGEIVLRESKVVEAIRPTRLPADLLAASESTLPYVREGAVRQLEHLLKGRNFGLAQSARMLLEKMAAEDDSRYIASAARQALESVPQIQEQPLRREESLRESHGTPVVQPTPVKMEDDQLMQRKADAVQLAKQNEELRKQTQPGVAPTPAKALSASWKRSSAAWAITFLVGISFIIFTTINLIGAEEQTPALPTNLPIVHQSTTFPTAAIPTATIASTDVSIASATVVFFDIVVVPTDSPTLTVTVPAEHDIPSDPARFIDFYFAHINGQNYDFTWTLLSKPYQERMNPHGIDQYVEDWSKYYKVEAGPIQPIYITESVVEVKFTATFYPHNGSKTPFELTYFLSNVNPEEIWMFINPPNFMCDNSPKRLSVGVDAQVVTAVDSLNMHETAASGTGRVGSLPPHTIVRVIEGPICAPYSSGGETLYFWWWKVQPSAGPAGWIAEGFDDQDAVFIQPAQ